MNENNHASSCVLASRCNVANTVRCNGQCPHWISLHGASGLGGRSAAVGLPKDYRLVTLSNSPVAENQPKIYETLRKYASTFERQFEDVRRAVYDDLIAKGKNEKEAESLLEIKSLYLHSSSPGTGKTTSAASLINEWLFVHYHGNLKRGGQVLQRPAYFLDVTELHRYYNGFTRQNIPRGIAEKSASNYYRMLDYAKKTPFVVFDDIGVRDDITNGFRGDLHDIINYRVTERFPTIYTSNIKLDDLPKVFGEERLYDRMRDQCAVLTFGGESKRGIRR